MNNAFLRLVRHPLKFRLYLLTRLPSAFFSGLRIAETSADHCVVTIPYRWFSRNPFRSIYFACLAMAAEMSTGVLAMAGVYKSNPPISMLVVNLEARFVKKATGRIRFSCNDGPAIRAAIDQAKATGEAHTVRALSTGMNANGETIAEFFITWSFKVKVKSHI